MRPLVVASVLLVSLAGCASPAPDIADASGTPLSGAAAVGGGPAAGAMHFGAADFNETSIYAGDFPLPNACTPLQDCPEQVQRFDLTQQVPADAPVELTATVTSDDFLQAYLEVEETSIVRMSSQAGASNQIAATLVRAQAGTVSLVVEHHSNLNGDPTAASVPFQAEVRSVVRSSIVPALLPVFAHLAPGDRIEAMGAGADDLDDIVVIPPGQDPIHLLKVTSFNVSADLPTGDYLVLVKGADAMLHGPNVTLRPARVERLVGEERAVPSSGGLTWTTSVPGIPLFAGLTISAGSTQGGVQPGFSYLGNFRLAIRQNGQDLQVYATDDCPAVCDFGRPVSISITSTGTSYLPEGMALGDLEFVVEAPNSSGAVAYDVVGYVAS